jgi:4-diphosphocytidyl-2C-methyl-D-erythritol kinase
VFGALGDVRGDGRATAELARAFETGAATPEVLRAAARNDLTAAAERVTPAVAAARAAARAKGIDLHVSGSGPSLFAIADDRAHAIHLSRALRRMGMRARAHAVAGPSPS